jgi:hypothetical protein
MDYFHAYLDASADADAWQIAAHEIIAAHGIVPAELTLLYVRALDKVNSILRISELKSNPDPSESETQSVLVKMKNASL